MSGVQTAEMLINAISCHTGLGEQLNSHFSVLSRTLICIELMICE